jgi:hypothetical protein
MKTIEAIEKVKELTLTETKNIFGGDYNPAEIVGLGIMSGILAGYFGTLGLAYAYYNFFKNK